MFGAITWTHLPGAFHALPFCVAAERRLLAELEANARCTCGGMGRSPVHDFPPCAVRLITRLHAEIVSLQVLAEEALTSSGIQPDSG